MFACYTRAMMSKYSQNVCLSIFTINIATNTPHQHARLLTRFTLLGSEPFHSPPFHDTLPLLSMGVIYL